MTNKELEGKYNEFKNKYNGKYVDTDYYPKDWPYQCFDLAQKYAQEVINVPDYVFAHCKVVKNLIYDPTQRAEMDQYFDEIDTHTMVKGDISIWGCGDAGHIAIFDYYNPEDNNCYYFSQNPNPCLVIPVNMQDHHAFRRKGIVNEEQPKEEPPVATNDLKIEDYVKIVGYGNGSSYGDSNQAVPGYEGTITSIYEGRPYPYEVSDNEGVLGYYPKESLTKLKNI